MSRYLKFDKSMYGTEGTIPLTRGDDWLLTGTIVLVGGCDLQESDVSDAEGASAFFPAASGGVLTGLITLTTPKCGKFSIALPGSASSGAMVSDAGIAPYVTLKEPGGLTTIPAIDQAVLISDPVFFS